MALELLGLAALGLAVGAYGTVIGAGGGLVMVPLLLLLYPGYGPQKVTAVSFAVIWANASSGSVAYARSHRIDYITGLLFVVSSVPGVIAGALTVQFVPERVFSVMFGVMLLTVAAVSIRGGRTQAVREPTRGWGVILRTVTDQEGRRYRYGYPAWQGVALSLGVGFLSSLFGIGGGVIHVPFMIILLHVPVEFAVATSHFVLAFMSGGASAIHLADGSLGGPQLLRAAALGAGAIPGAQAGAIISHRIRGRGALRLLAVAIVALGVRLVVRGVTGH